MNISAAEFAILEAKQAAKLHGKECPSQQKASHGVERERDLHDAIERECRRRRLYYVHSRMDVPATNGVGTPDFIIALPGGRTVWCEVKSATGKLTIDQQAAAKWLKDVLGHRHAVVRNFEQFIDLLSP